MTEEDDGLEDVCDKLSGLTRSPLPPSAPPPPPPSTSSPTSTGEAKKKTKKPTHLFGISVLVQYTNRRTAKPAPLARYVPVWKAKSRSPWRQRCSLRQHPLRSLASEGKQRGAGVSPRRNQSVNTGTVSTRRQSH